MEEQVGGGAEGWLAVSWGQRRLGGRVHGCRGWTADFPRQQSHTSQLQQSFLPTIPIPPTPVTLRSGISEI